jgi:magnesium transporter
MTHPLFGPEVRLMLDDNDEPAMRAFCENLHPATVAEALAEGFSVEESWRVLGQSPIGSQANIFGYFPSEKQIALVEGTGTPHMARLIERMSHDDRVDLLRHLPKEVSDGLLRLVDEADRRDIATLVSYPENTVGALMTTDYAWLPANLTADQAIDRLRQQAPNSETIYYIYVLDETTRRLHGIVSLRELILARKNALVSDLMEREIVTLKAIEDREKAAELLARFDLLAIPVVDDDSRLIGIVTYDDAIDVVVQEATEDLQMQGGIVAITENYLEAGFVTVWRKRSFWLACLFGAELFTFTALSFFEDAISKLVVLSLFVPLCISTGGNSGSQAATLITRALALGQISLKNWGRALRHEVAMGLMLGLTLGTIGFVRGALTPESTRGGSREYEEPFAVRVSRDQPLSMAGREVPIRATQSQMVFTVDRDKRIELPDDTDFVEVDGRNPAYREYQFPAKCRVREAPVSRWKLAQVIAFAVTGICLWGTLVGSMLPLVFKRFGIDPAIASSPFVATFVDVTGIVIYFSIAKVYLL